MDHARMRLAFFSFRGAFERRNDSVAAALAVVMLHAVVSFLIRRVGAVATYGLVKQAAAEVARAMPAEPEWPA